jgi:hypothetical protein
LLTFVHPAVHREIGCPFCDCGPDSQPGAVASIGENTPESRTTIGEGRQRGVADVANRIEILSDQPPRPRQSRRSQNLDGVYESVA